MRGEVCVGAASFFTFAASVIMVFAMIGQINPTPVPRVLSMIRLDVSNFGSALAANVSGVSTTGLYASATNVSTLGVGGGLRNEYKWGLLNYCGYMSSNVGSCNNTGLGHAVKPLETLLADVPSNLQSQVSRVLPSSSSSIGANYTNRLTQAAFWLIFIGSCAALLAFISGVIPHRLAFLVAAFWAIVSALGLAVGAAIWTAIYVKAKSAVNAANIGITAHFGNGIILTWVAFALVLLSIVPYIISCCTFRR